MYRTIAAVLLALTAACGSSNDSKKTEDVDKTASAGPGSTGRRTPPRLPPLPRRTRPDGDAGTGERRDRPSLDSPDDGEPAGRRWGGRMEQFDKNGDGQLDEAERTAMMEEGKARMRERLDRVVTEMDGDQDGKISRAEAEAFAARPNEGGDEGMRRRRGPRMAERFDEMDTNGDGFLTSEEMAESMPMRGRRGFGRDRGGDDPR